MKVNRFSKAGSIVIFLMLTFLSVSCGGDSSSGDEPVVFQPTKNYCSSSLVSDHNRIIANMKILTSTNLTSATSDEILNYCKRVDSNKISVDRFLNSYRNERCIASIDGRESQFTSSNIIELESFLIDAQTSCQEFKDNLNNSGNDDEDKDENEDSSDEPENPEDELQECTVDFLQDFLDLNDQFEKFSEVSDQSVELICQEAAKTADLSMDFFSKYRDLRCFIEDDEGRTVVEANVFAELNEKIVELDRQCQSRNVKGDMGSFQMTSFHHFNLEAIRNVLSRM